MSAIEPIGHDVDEDPSKPRAQALSVAVTNKQLPKQLITNSRLQTTSSTINSSNSRAAEQQCAAHKFL
ncbi:hypothetical protein V6Z88_004038 [Aspergillus fumigatus]|jgi:hypothetical protein|uniref:Uncharacterized protein n=2 Tax=Aspergillus fumigatus TaxID=746128 RepID=Q4WM66_ASPFU|nr:hypothetical protein AFUA_6G11000 [Aspergillus fumigatus Af293]EAL88948.1 hypothetical protein AFUA_6G11000 [Aspergillus fumigatus Af293]EDP49673.1 hypothetical protein AFUB_077030 [Aspergillus fumigatus A1163]